MTAKLSVNLRHHRTKSALTQAELADAVGVSRKTINTIENAIFTPSTHLALLLAQALGCSVHDLFQLKQ